MTRLDAGTALGLWANRHKARALRELDARNARGELTAEGLYDLILAATGDRDRAEKAMRDLIADRLRAGETPA